MRSNRVGVVVVLYNIDAHKIDFSFSLIKNQVDNIIVVDNSDVEDYVTFNTDYFLLDSKYNYYSMGGNLGIGAAHNFGAKKVAELGCDFCLLLDQDSILPDSFVDTMLTNYLAIQKKDNEVALIGPTIITYSSPLVCGSQILDPVRTKQVISSGSFFKSDLINEIEMDETLFIDEVDHDWCWRIGEKKRSIYIVDNCYLKHKLGVGSFSLFGKNVIISAPIRNFYEARNYILLLKKKYPPVYWKYRTGLLLVIKVILSPLMGDTLERFKYLSKGIISGIKGRRGKINE